MYKIPLGRLSCLDREYSNYFYNNGEIYMQLKTLVKATLVTLSIVAVTACTHTKKNMDSTMGVADANGGSSQTAGIGDGSSYGNQNASSSDKAALEKTTYYFEFDRSEVSQSDLPAIYAQANYLLSHPNAKIVLEGHTDPRGSREYNVGLGERRANAIAAILRSKGVNPNQIRILSYGAERPAANGRTEQDFQLDRRSVVVHIQG
jgi:peptidoglycan-associated lipoprotein